jgi:hypothetical protein
MVMTKKVPVLMGLVLGLHHGDSTPLGANWVARLPRGWNMSQYAMNDTKKEWCPYFNI